ncbi:DUF3231 family protein [Neobacillus vireti]|uniref:DUF3231 family protein n=1 Tax=Neobacillus vireti LMG 21834 TaxID=1131730 RepID=A0AB94IPU5_9BACI|nr:DUF3231 family protein [Neobacillus vireti]ETI69080.1 hypothetical protein BAVI_09981 [Neobacillus vireti LMG 21834]KLT15650.1 hypothetical protein AA980_20580 [Neobacillus vireti]
MKEKENIRLTAGEMSALWTQYINDTLATCVNSYFLEKVEDEEVRPVVEWVLDTAKENISIMQELFRRNDFPIPIGFTEQDVNPQAPRLFSDTFFLMYLRHMSNIAMAASSAALGLVTRPDVVDFHKRILQKAVRLQDRTRDLMLKQGTYVRPPYISTPDKVGFVEKQHFLAGFFGNKRTLSSVEVSNLFLNVQSNAVGKVLITGFAQTAQDGEVREFFNKGKQLSQKYIDVFSSFLIKDNLPAPMSWDSAVSNTTRGIFSDKLMMYHVSAMIATGIGNFGMGIAASPRRDLGLKYASLIPEISLYAEDGAKIMIKHGWLEEPPLADDRDQLIKS